MGDEDATVVSTVHDHGNGVENYECYGCRADTTFTGFNCSVYPNNSDRIREYNRKYVY